LLVLLLVAMTASAQEWPQVVLLYSKSSKRVDKKAFLAAAKKGLGFELPKYKLREFNKAYKPNAKEPIAVSLRDDIAFFVRTGKKSYFEDRKRAAKKAQNADALNAVMHHKAWFELGGFGEVGLIKQYSEICRVTMELVDEDTMAIFFPEFDRFFLPGEKDLRKKMRAKDPLVALGLTEGVKKPDRKLTEEEKVIIEAVREARADWSTFRSAVVNGEGSMHWVWVGDPLDVKNWKIVDVTAIGKKSVRGKQISPGPGKGKEITAGIDNVVDWSYHEDTPFLPRDPKERMEAIQRAIRGNYVMDALAEYGKKKKAKKEAEKKKGKKK
jgi:hypothetical protein